MLIEFKDKTVIKTFGSKNEARRICKLYNTFPYHVKAKTSEEKLIYNYIVGDTLQSILNDKPRSTEVLKSLGSILSEVHFIGCKVLPGYETICRDRNYFPDPSKFITSNQYTSKIHGDLNTRNIIVSSDNKITLIDRYAERGDIMFDFTFIMSILCQYLLTNDIEYKLMITIFFNEYIKRIKDKEGFFRSFRNNFLGYGYYVYYDTDHRLNDFKEWSEGIKIAQELSKYNSFLDYLETI